MRNTTWQSINQSLAILSLLALAMLLAGAGCSDSGSPAGPGGDDNTADSVSFADDVFPIFQTNCSGGSCHIPGPEASTGLSLKDYASLMNGSNSGHVLIHGDAENSELVKRLEGRSQPSMPFGRSLLPASTVKIVRDWIDQGAKDN